MSMKAKAAANEAFQRIGIDVNTLCTGCGLSEDDMLGHSGTVEAVIRSRFLQLAASECEAEILDFLKNLDSLSLKAPELIKFLLMEDLVEVASVDFLPCVLQILDTLLRTHQDPLYSTRGAGLTVLRIVNHLRRRLSKANNAQLAGSALLLLTRIFPASERSGLNLKGDKNSDNHILRSLANPAAGTDFAAEFWDFYRLLFGSSSEVLAEQGLLKAMTATSRLLTAVELHVKQESTQAKTSIQAQHSIGSYCVYHLTDESSLVKQLQDPSFRVALLAQLLVYFEELSEYETQNISSRPEIESWINDSTKLAFSLISQHRNGRKIFEFIRMILRNERNWIRWKQNSCAPYEKLPANVPSPGLASPSIAAEQVTEFGNRDLARLLSQTPSAVTERKLKPSPGPEDLMDSSWRALRLSRKLMQN